jgi:thioredoxin 1
VPALVECWQPGCGHCQALLQELKLIQAKFRYSLVINKMNVQEIFRIPGEREIHALPTETLSINSKFA